MNKPWYKSGWALLAAAVVIFIALSGAFGGEADKAGNRPYNTAPIASNAVEGISIAAAVHTPEPTLEPISTTNPEPIIIPTADPTQEPTIAPTAEPFVEAVVIDEPQSQTVYVTRTGEKYHRDGCQYLRKSQIPTSLDDAIASGYTPCSKCHPPR